MANQGGDWGPIRGAHDHAVGGVGAPRGQQVAGGGKVKAVDAGGGPCGVDGFKGVGGGGGAGDDLVVWGGGSRGRGRRHGVDVYVDEFVVLGAHQQTTVVQPSTNEDLVGVQGGEFAFSEDGEEGGDVGGGAVMDGSATMMFFWGGRGGKKGYMGKVQSDREEMGMGG